MKNLELLLAVAGGAVVGAAIGVLFAPKKGEDIRNDIKEFIKSKCPATKESSPSPVTPSIAMNIPRTIVCVMSPLSTSLPDTRRETMSPAA